MTRYRRATIAGGTYFFTVNCAERHGNHLLTDNVDLLRQSFRKVKTDHPYSIDAMVILPEHLHCVWTLPQGDSDYKTRWGLIKAGFSRALPSGETVKAVKGSEPFVGGHACLDQLYNSVSIRLFA